MTWFLLWLISGIVSAGIWVAYIQRSFPSLAKKGYAMDLSLGLLTGIAFGPVALVVSFFFCGFCEHGWTLLPPKE